MLWHESEEDDNLPYPTSDGRPLAETDVHREQIVDLIGSLKLHFRKRSDVYVSGNLLMFYEPGNRRRHRSPDVLVALGVKAGERDFYKVWEEGKAPDLVFEITSASTRSEDLGEKKGIYAMIGVQEYVIFDPLKEYLEPRLRMYRRAGEEFVPVAGKLRLETVNLEPEIVDDRLRLRDPATGRLLPTLNEVVEEAEERVEEAEARADEAEARAERLAARLRELGVEE